MYNTKGRSLLKEMAANNEESVMSFYELLREYYPYLLERKTLTREEIHRYNSMANANIYNMEIRKAIKITDRQQ